MSRSNVQGSFLVSTMDRHSWSLNVDLFLRATHVNQTPNQTITDFENTSMSRFRICTL